MRFAALGHDAGLAYAARLLTLCGATRVPGPGGADVVLDATGTVAGAVPVTPRTPRRDWAASGAMALTGRADGPPLEVRAAPATAVRGALAAFRALTGATALPGPELLGERAAAAGLTRRGPASPGGAFRLLRARDGRWAGLSLARDADAELVPALVERAVVDDPWAAVGEWTARTDAVAVRERAHLLGIPAAVVPRPGERDEQLIHRHGHGLVPPFTFRRIGPRRAAGRPGGARRPLVLDLSSLWAGPLCAHLLGIAGMRVIKVESTRRPDGARRGEPAFYDLLHAGHEAVALDLTSRHGVILLRELLTRADVVIEGSRPRALAHLGIDPREIAAARPGLAWVAITAYGRTGPWADRPGFGDDVAAAAGLVAWDETGPVPCGDTIADPLTGVHAAVAAVAALRAGGGLLADVAMREVALATVPGGPGAPADPADAAGDPAAGRTAAGWTPAGWTPAGWTGAGWTGAPGPRSAGPAGERDRGVPRAVPPRARRPAGVAPALGADTTRVLAETEHAAADRAEAHPAGAEPSEARSAESDPAGTRRPGPDCDVGRRPRPARPGGGPS